MRRRAKNQQSISHTEIDNAVQEFLSVGGKITHLPDQKLYVPTVIGGDRWDAYENISNFGA